VKLYQLVSRKPARNAFAGIDLIHHIGETSPLIGFAAAAAAKYWRIPFVVQPTCHPHIVGDSPLDLRLFAKADRMLAHTKYEANHFRKKSFRCPIDVVGNGIEDRADGNAERFRSKFGIAGPLILFIGRKDPQKGYPLLRDAFKLIRRQRRDISLVCMGPPGSTGKQQELEGLIDLDFTSEELKHDALAACTCVCIPSEGESFGLVYMEAGRYGKPSVGRQVPVLQELLNDGNAVVLLGIQDESCNRAMLSSEALATALLKLLSDPKECHRIGENCRAVSEQFLWSRVIRQFEASYYQAVDDVERVRGPKSLSDRMTWLQDPNELRKLPRLLRAVAWRAPLEFGELIGKLRYRPIDCCLNRNKLVEHISERGDPIDETAVTTGQQELLFRALAQTAEMSAGIAEIGAWRGITTAALAGRTDRRVYAIDPYKENEFPGVNEAFQAFRERTSAFSNVVHLRCSSGEAARELSGTRLSLIFVDAIHDYINTWFDFRVWSNLLVPGGIILFHDVDDHTGANLACRRILRQKKYRVWGYCPNLVALKKETSV
jgi:glycosyltransferase involved in cell wall biosynthesis/predicted O-methyltransferase YrrM